MAAVVIGLPIVALLIPVALAVRVYKMPLGRTDPVGEQGIQRIAMTLIAIGLLPVLLILILFSGAERRVRRLVARARRAARGGSGAPGDPVGADDRREDDV